ncbi:MAG: type I methionyl aminopeptidase [Firmicutes bacterium]|nr:type I methionyl aminopeptidase [Bacillota bacterium]
MSSKTYLKDYPAAVKDHVLFCKSQGMQVPPPSLLKTPEHLEKIRASARINVALLDYMDHNIKAGISTEQIDRWVYQITTDLGGIPAPLNYEGFPKSVCTSIDDVVCHGIPSSREILKDGQIINIDCSTILDGYFSDSSRMYCIGEVSEEKRRLVRVTKECVELGLAEVKPWARLGDMAAVINAHARKNGYSVVREIGGHGVGLEFHEDPWVSYVAPAGTGMVMVPGMVFTIEPMVNMGRAGFRINRFDGWTVRTADHKPSAQWEIMVLVTETGYEVLAW